MHIKIRMHPTVVVLGFLFIIMGYLKEFLLLFIFVSVHEAAHIITAKRHQIDLKEVLVTPIGLNAVLEGLDNITPSKKISIFIAGPAASFVLAFFCFLLRLDPYVIYSNLILGIFNCIPVLPLDGGRILYTILDGEIGAVQAAKKMTLLGSVVGYSMIAIGVIQLVLYPINFSLLAIGIYLTLYNKKVLFELTSRLFTKIIHSDYHNDPLRLYAAKKEETLKSVIERIRSDSTPIILYYLDHQITSIGPDEISEAVKEGKVNLPVQNLK